MAAPARIESRAAARRAAGFLLPWDTHGLIPITAGTGVLPFSSTGNDAHMSRFFAIAVSCLSAAAVLAGGSGCGTSSYRAEMDATLARLKKREAEKPLITLTQFHGYMRDTEALGDNWVNLRIPQMFKKIPLTDYAPDPENNEPVDPRRLYPAGIPLPHYERTYEALPDESTPSGAQGDASQTPEVRLPCSLYVGAGQAEGTTLDELAQSLTQQLRGAELEVPDKWQDIEVPTPDGTAVVWKMTHAKGPLFFDSFRGGEHMKWDKHDAVVELYLHEEQGVQVVIGFKAAAAAPEAAVLEQAMPLIAASVVVKRPTGQALANSPFAYTGSPTDAKWVPYTLGLSFVVGYGEGMARAKNLGRPVMLFIIATDSEACLRHAGENFQDPEVRELLAKFACVVVDGKNDPDIELVGDVSFPRTLFLKPDGTQIGRLDGAIAPDEFKQHLRDMLATVGTGR